MRFEGPRFGRTSFRYFKNVFHIDSGKNRFMSGSIVR
jgi:hypothetical protein